MQVDVLFVFTQISEDWLEQLDPATKEAILNGDFNTKGNVNGFPWPFPFPHLSTFQPQGEGAESTAIGIEQANLYASLTEYSLRVNEPKLRQCMGLWIWCPTMSQQDMELDTTDKFQPLAKTRCKKCVFSLRQKIDQQMSKRLLGTLPQSKFFRNAEGGRVRPPRLRQGRLLGWIDNNRLALKNNRTNLATTTAPKHKPLKSTSHCSKPLRRSERFHTASEVKQQVYCCQLPRKRHLEPHLELRTIQEKCEKWTWIDCQDPRELQYCQKTIQNPLVFKSILKRTMVVLIFKQRESCSYDVCIVGLL